YEMPAFASPSSEKPAENEASSSAAAETAGSTQSYYRAEVFLQRGGLDYDVYGYTQQELIGDILDHFERYLSFLQISPGVLPWNMAEHDDMLQERPDEEGLARP